MKKTWAIVSFVAALPFVFSIILNSGCGSSPTSASSGGSNPTATWTPFVNASNTPCAQAFGNYDTVGIGLTPIPPNAYVAIQFPHVMLTPDYPGYNNTGGSAGIYVANSGSSPETIELAAYGSEASIGGPPYGSAVSIQVPALSSGAWQLVTMPNISYTDYGPDVYLAAHAIGADLSIGAKGTSGLNGSGGTKSGTIGGLLPTPTATINGAPNFEMFVKLCP
jgi:hypothetical protein